MQKTRSMIKAHDGAELALTVYSPDGDPRGIIHMVHGFGEYMTRYESWAERFCAEGYVFAGIDLRGHGSTPGKRGVVKDYNLLLDDVITARDMIASQFPGSPVILYGHSMGGNIALNVLLRRDVSGYKCAVICAPWLINAKPLPAPLVAIVRGLAAVMPGFTINSGLSNDVLSHDQDQIALTNRDGLGHSQIGTRLLTGVLDGGKYALEHARELPLPTLLLQAGDDKLVNAGAIDRFAELAGDKVTYAPYPGMYHELHNETNRDEVYAKVSGYISVYAPVVEKRQV